MTTILTMQRSPLIAALLLTIGAPAAAADGLSCILDAIPTEARSAIAASFARGGAVSDEAVSVIQTAMPTCVERFGWSELAANAAIEFAVSTILLSDMASSGPVSPEQVALLDRAFAALDPSVGSNLRVNGELGDDHARIVGETAAATGVAINAETGSFIGAYFAARWMVADVRRRFAEL